jgi:hypothetical protein
MTPLRSDFNGSKATMPADSDPPRGRVFTARPRESVLPQAERERRANEWRLRHPPAQAGRCGDVFSPILPINGRG